jgi:FtsP/CotA-like multicopper oxidase with cupredoxin domain
LSSRIPRATVAAIGLLLATATPAQIPFTRVPVPSGVNNAFPAQNANGPTGVAQQVNYPYAGQCNADPRNAALFPQLPGCAGGTGSFACVAGPTGAAFAPQTAGGWMSCGGATPPVFTPRQPLIANSVAVAPATATPRFVWDLLNPPDYVPDTTTFPGADYYEIGVHEAWGFQAVASAGLFPNPPTARPAVPDGMQWTGLVCTLPAGCSCPAGVDPNGVFGRAYCSSNGRVPNGAPLYTPIWGVGQINGGGGPVTQALTTAGLFAAGVASPWSANNYVATWPSISIRGTKDRPVVVKWVNEFPNNHLFCPHPEAADWPCAVDRTFMGVKSKIDPALATTLVPPEGVNLYGSPQQPDNSWVTHLHGGETPPSTDGFAEKWFGNATTAAAYLNVAQNFVQPPFENPSRIMLKRPAGNADVYTYPMVNEEATIWFHDHTLGKTHHNVIAGPAGFFPVKEPLKHGKVTNGACTPAAGQTCEYTWLDPVTEPRNGLNQPLFDLFLAIQDRAFNDDGTINFTNGLGQAIPAGVLPVGYNPITNGVNPQVHPQFVPEYFGDHALVNGVLWPKVKTAPGWYRLRIVDGSDARCYTLGFQTTLPAPGTKPNPNVPFYVIANDQGYLQAPVLAPGGKLTMCPGERYEVLVNFGAFAAAPVSIYMTNEAKAPFPAGIAPYSGGAGVSPYAEMNVIMRFDVNAAYGVGLKSCGAAGAPAASSWDPAYTQAQMVTAIGGTPGTPATACMPANPALVPPLLQNYAGLPRPTLPIPAGTIVRQVYLNERADGVTLAPLGMQLNGVPFEYKVTETPRKNTVEVWQFVNLTVDAHPLHPHLVRHLVVGRQNFNVGQFKALLCGSTTCQPGTAPGGEMQVVPDVAATLSGTPTLVTAASVEGGWKDAVQVMPGQVTTIIASWSPRWAAGSAPTAPGTAGCPAGTTGCAAPYVYEDVTTGPYVWHCHINSHEDSEMMRTSLVVP